MRSRMTKIYLKMKARSLSIKRQKAITIIVSIGFTIMLLTLVYEFVSLNNENSDLRNELKPISDFYKEHKTFIENHKKEHESTMILPVVPGI